MRKAIKLEYFRPNDLVQDERINLDLEGMFNDLYYRLRNGEVIRYEFNLEIAKIARVFFHEDIRSFHIVFERMRDFNLPVKSSFERDSEPIDLEEDEYIGEEVSLLYDVDNRILLIQRNRDSLSPTAIELFLRDIYNNFTNQQTNLEINPILRENALDLILNSDKIRKISVRVDDLGQEIEYEDDLSNITQTVNPYEATSLEFTLSVGRERDREMDKNFARRLVQSIAGRRNVTKAQAYVKMDEESNVEKYDLLEHKVFSIVTFDFREDRTIRPDAIFDRMRSIYIGENNDGMRDQIMRM